MRRGITIFAILSFYDIAIQYLFSIRTYSPETRILIDTVDIHFVREARQAELCGDQKMPETRFHDQGAGVIDLLQGRRPDYRDGAGLGFTLGNFSPTSHIL
ncbi:MAG: hypothetical protein MZV70_35285 [Desulfobacterales bacterium]|nr:hypothetical protein [Desulfobacterales bacterium]